MPVTIKCFRANIGMLAKLFHPVLHQRFLCNYQNSINFPFFEPIKQKIYGNLCLAQTLLVEDSSIVLVFDFKESLVLIGKGFMLR